MARGHCSELDLVLQDVQRFYEAITACQDADAILRETGDRVQRGPEAIWRCSW